MVGLRKALERKLTKAEQRVLRAGFDIVGDIAIIEVPKGLVKKQRVIAKTLMEIHKNVKTVLKKVGFRAGKYRRQKLAWVAGRRTKVAEYKESGVRMRLDVEKCYFSPRLGTERLRLARLIKPNERVLVMFSGVAPYPLIIAKQTRAKEVVGVELNPIAHKYALENISLNKMGDRIRAYLGDVRKVVPRLGKFDRVIVPAPAESSFLDVALKAAKRGAFIHCSDFVAEGNEREAKENVYKACRAHKRKCRIVRVVRTGHPKPRTSRVCVDVRA